MKKILLLLLLLSHSAFALEFARYPEKLSSGEGVDVVVLATKEGTQALVKVTGVNSDIDGVVFLTHLKTNESGSSYKYTFDGSERNLIYVDKSYGCCSYELYVPDTRDGVRLYKADKADAQSKTILPALYQQQLQQGLQAKLAAFNRAKHLDTQQQTIIAANKRVLEHCGAEIPTQIDWQQIDDATLGKYAVAAICAQVSEKLAQHCDNQTEFKQQAKQFKAISCEFTDKLKLRNKDHVLHFKTSPLAPNQGDFIKAYLNNL